MAGKPSRRCKQNPCAAAAPDAALILDLYCAEVLAQGPARLSLRKLWAPLDPNDRSVYARRGYYLVWTQAGRVGYRRFGLTELTAARRCFTARMLRLSDPSYPA